eukprot:8176278-Pyramimonas_sp.AAC.1
MTCAPGDCGHATEGVCEDLPPVRHPVRCHHHEQHLRGLGRVFALRGARRGAPAIAARFVMMSPRYPSTYFNSEQISEIFTCNS